MFSDKLRFPSTGEDWMTKEENGLGIAVSTDADGKASASVPGLAQVLDRITSLGVEPSNRTTDVIVKWLLRIQDAMTSM
jgi:hypothetical protein